MVDPGFPRGGAPTPRGGAPTYDFAKFPQKLHEIERFWAPPLDPPLLPPLLFLLVSEQLRIYMLKFWMRPPSQSNFLNYHTVFGEIFMWSIAKIQPVRLLLSACREGFRSLWKLKFQAVIICEDYTNTCHVKMVKMAIFHQSCVSQSLLYLWM